MYAIRAHKMHIHYPTLSYYIFIINYPLGSMALYGSIYSTLGLSIERFLGERAQCKAIYEMHQNSCLARHFSGVWFPMQSRTRPRRHLLVYLIPLIVLSVILNLPKAFEMRAMNIVEVRVYHSYHNTPLNEVQTKKAGFYPHEGGRGH